MLRRLYPTRRTEPDMREELRRMLQGVYPEISKKQYFVLRKMRLNDDNEMIDCPCVDPVTHEPDIDYYCPVCSGEGKLWDEIFIEAYKVVKQSDVGLSGKERLIAPGLMNIQYIVIYTTYDAEITENDKIVELDTEKGGLPTLPYRRKKLYRINTLIDLRSDNAKLEYWKLACYEEDRKFLNGVT